MPTTTPFALPYPAGTDSPNVPYWNQQLAQRIRDLMNLPAPAQTTYTSGGNDIVGTAYSKIPNIAAITQTYTTKTVVQVTIQGMFGGASTVNNGRVALQASGALNDTRTQLREVALCAVDRSHTTLTHVFVCPAGTTTFTPLAANLGGDFQCDYPRLDVVPLRVAA